MRTQSNAQHRRNLLDHGLLYLMSYDIVADRDIDVVGPVPGGLRQNVRGDAALSFVYHILREKLVDGLGTATLRGALLWGEDWLLWRQDDIAESDVRLAFRTDDGATIHATYLAVASLGPGGFQRLVKVPERDSDRIGEEDKPVELQFVTAPRFETSDPTYAWLMDYQCIGIGKYQLIGSKIRRITYDVYALT